MLLLELWFHGDGPGNSGSLGTCPVSGADPVGAIADALLLTATYTLTFK